MSRHTLLYTIRNEHIRKGFVATIEDKIKENRLRWFGHVQKHGMRELVRKIKGRT